MKSWLPNWKRESEYPSAHGTPKYIWAWEFLRRNENYQKDFIETTELIEKTDYWGAVDRRNNIHLDWSQKTKDFDVQHEVMSKIQAISAKYSVMDKRNLLPFNANQN